MKFLAALLALCASALAAVPTVGGLTVGPISSGAVTLSSSVTTNDSTTNVTFRYGFGGNLDKKQVVSLSNASSAQTAKVNLTSLVGGQTYHFKVEAVNGDGTTEVDGSDFTVPGYAPTIVLQNTTTPLGGKATLKATITSNGAATTVTFSYGTTTSYGTTVTATPVLLAADVDKAVTASLEGLDRGTTYHFKATATSTLGTTNTADTIFLAATNAAPIAKADTATLRGRTPIVINVLKNDSDKEGDVISISSVTQGKQGKVEIVGSQIRYTPGDGTTWPDTFTYTVEDNYLGTLGVGATATSTVTVKAPGLAAEGLHSATIKDADGNIVGIINLLGTAGGTVSGKILYGNERIPISGTLDANGHFHASLNHSGDSPLEVDITFDQSGATTLNATVNDDGKEFTASAPLTTLTAARREELNGRYTVQLPGPTGTDAPKGTGFAYINVTPCGEVSIRGKYGDGSKFYTRSALGGAGDVAAIDIWAARKNSQLSGTLAFGTGTTPTLTGTLNWSRQPERGATFFPDGFTASVAASGAIYTPPDDGDRSLGKSSKASNLTLRDGNLLSPITHNLVLNKRDGVEILDQGPENMTLKIDRKKGIFKGEFDHPQDGSRRKFQGVLLQDKSIGRGVFLGQNQTGTVEFNLGAAKPPTTGGTTGGDTGANGGTGIDLGGQNNGDLNFGN